MEPQSQTAAKELESSLMQQLGSLERRTRFEEPEEESLPAASRGVKRIGTGFAFKANLSPEELADVEDMEARIGSTLQSLREPTMNFGSGQLSASTLSLAAQAQSASAGAVRSLRFDFSASSVTGDGNDGNAEPIESNLAGSSSSCREAAA